VAHHPALAGGETAMNCPRLAASVFLAGLSLQASSLKQSFQHDVKICIEAGFGGPWVLTQAEATTTQMFANLGIGIEWFHDSRHCKVPPEGSLSIRLSTHTPDQEFPGALAYSRLDDEMHIQVFYDRVTAMVESRRVPKLLAHVLAHEIAHMLEGVDRHSGTGVMKAHWDERDFVEMSDKPMAFAPEDVDLIQRGVTQREMVARFSPRSH
jgi:hypothetical protein